MNLTDRERLIALAHLKTGKTPKQTSELCSVSYAQALNLNKKLVEAEKRNTVLELFNLKEAALETLLESVQSQLSEASTDLAIVDELTGEVSELREEFANLSMLDKEMQDAATELTKKIKVQAVLSTEISTLLVLAEALSELRKAFFATGTNIQVNNLNSDNFQKYLSD